MMRWIAAGVAWMVAMLTHGPIRWTRPPFVVAGEAYRIVNREPVETLDVAIAIDGELIRTRLLDPGEAWAPVIPFVAGREVVIRADGLRRSSALYTVVVP